jgi:hypothetical protein
VRARRTAEPARAEPGRGERAEPPARADGRERAVRERTVRSGRLDRVGLMIPPIFNPADDVLLSLSYVVPAPLSLPCHD